MLRLLICLVLCAACSASPNAPDPGDNQEIDDGSTYFPGDAWRSARPAALRIDSAGLATLVRNAGSGRYGALHGLIVIRNGYVAAEQYYNWNRTEPHTMQSVTKSRSEEHTSEL